MRIYINRTTGQFITSPTFDAAVLRYDFKRGDTTRIEIGFVEDSVLIPLVGAYNIDFGLKEDGKYDGDYVVYEGTFVYNATTGFYDGEPSFNTTELNDLLNADIVIADNLAYRMSSFYKQVEWLCVRVCRLTPC